MASISIIQQAADNVDSDYEQIDNGQHPAAEADAGDNPATAVAAAATAAPVDAAVNVGDCIENMLVEDDDTGPVDNGDPSE